MLTDFIKTHFVSQAANDKGGFVKFGFGQVEPNHLSAQRTSQVYAQLPAAPSINILEQGQFVKYDYAAKDGSTPTGGLVDFTGAGEWMLVYNEIKLYRDHQWDCEFAMLKDNYQARIYSPYDWDQPELDKQSRFYNQNDLTGTGADGYLAGGYKVVNGELKFKKVDGTEVAYPVDDVTGPVDPYEIHYNADPYHILGKYHPRKMPKGTTMVPRVFKTNVGDIFTTNTVMETSLAVGDLLTPRAADGILSKTGASTADMKWQVVRVYTMPDGQPGVKVMRVK